MILPGVVSVPDRNETREPMSETQADIEAQMRKPPPPRRRQMRWEYAINGDAGSSNDLRDRLMALADSEVAAAVLECRRDQQAPYDEIHAERLRAHAKHAATSMESQPVHDPEGTRRDIIVEEVGEVSREFNEARHDGRAVDLAHLRTELIQLAAMASAWVAAIDGNSLAALAGEVNPE